MNKLDNHLFPFSNDQNRNISADIYFQYANIDEEKQQFETNFVGRNLKGRLVALDPSIEGRVFEKLAPNIYDEEAVEMDDSAQNIPWTATNKTINEFILWKKNALPDEDDPRIKSLKDWIAIAQDIHTPIAVEKQQ
ncbi:hypothetical protein BDF20DRAFT_833349 [Mycotypha africana]|uniref:uncharacterized protein n=1 Tax=Mycotypha africana TaxID=64632 RepID=UPI0023013418|nr:uncharacterized protein BDF20DRAFT_833349 [Mycotypha africana]KAI8988504.1 hypothetical protein BDF20DRAFT_833349 [Mycotypha africana]